MSESRKPPSRGAVERTAELYQKEVQRSGGGDIGHDAAKARVVDALQKKGRT